MDNKTESFFETSKSFVSNSRQTMLHHHYHDNFEIYFLEEGSCNYFIDNKIYKIGKNDMIFIPQ